MGLFTTYESTDDDGQAGSATLPDYAENFVGDFSPAKDYVQRPPKPQNPKLMKNGCFWISNSKGSWFERYYI